MVIEETGKGALGGRQPVAFVRIAHLVRAQNWPVFIEQLLSSKFQA